MPLGYSFFMAESETDPSDETPSDETKRKFREALERKKAKSAGNVDHKDIGGKQVRAHGVVENRREFRRRSGSA